jgi:hypothetical protein
MKILYKPDNDAEALAIKLILEENSIDSTIQSFHDTAYDGLYQNQYGWGIVKVFEKDFIAAQKLVTDWKDNPPEDIDYRTNNNEETSNISITGSTLGIKTFIKTIAPIVFVSSVLVNIYFFSYWLYSTFQDNSVFKQYDRNGYLMSISEWGNNYESPYKYTLYSTSGEKLAEFYDLNDSGRSDMAIENRPKSTITSFDKNNNGIYDSFDELFENGSQIKHLDKDENRVFETSVIADKENNIIYSISNNNLTGYPEKVVTPNGKVVEIDILKQISKLF